MELIRVGDEPCAAWEVRLGDQPVATASLGAGSGEVARHLRLEVESEHRRRGIGSRLLAAASEHARAAGSQVLEAMVVCGSAGDAFAARHGAVVGDELIDADLLLGQVDVPRLEELVAGLPASFELARRCDPVPQRLVGSYARAKLAIADSPNRFPAADAWRDGR